MVRDPAHPVSLVVVGASAGGVEALKSLAAGLPADLACPVVVVLHVSSSGTSVLPQILARAGELRAHAAVDGELLTDGVLYVAPPNCHVIATPTGIRLSGGVRENGHRPAVDPTMRSAAQAFGPGAIGVVLSGTRDDGTAGAAAIKAAGGRVLVQDPAEALYVGMPASVIANVNVDAVLGVAEIARWLADAARGRGHEPSPLPAAVPADAVSFRGDTPSDVGTRFTCPDCGGVLFEVERDGVTQLACSVGHVYSPESLSVVQGIELERALWTATRALEDRAVLLERMATRARSMRQPRSAEGFERQARDARAHTALIRNSMLHHDGSDDAPARVRGGR